VKVGYRSNIITGCTILDNGKVLFSEYSIYNETDYTDRMTLNDSAGNYIRTVQESNAYIGSLYDITSIDTNTIAVSTKPSNTFLTTSIVKFTTAVSNSITITVIVLN
jgi:hypothetical protein